MRDLFAVAPQRVPRAEPRRMLDDTLDSSEPSDKALLQRLDHRVSAATAS
jgi:hypothetical protein